MSDRIKILIADDHPIVRQGLRKTIESAAENNREMEIVGEAGDGEEALTAARTLRPAIILLDVDLPKMSGFEVMQALRDENIEAKVIFLTVHREESFMRKALDLGAAGYVLKDSAVTDIVAAIRAVSENLSFISPAMTSYLIRSRSAPGDGDLGSLTKAERRVLRLIAQYKTTKEIAEMLFVSPRTVESHRATITQKLGLHGSHSLMRYALQHLAEIEQD
ncbi:MAG TPA: response regulator transcription factor [Pyrinomonadaceae bacterium]|jgi:DNA-binding NarL/FixJ family response regulator|nr:response regulator transcription factor [Pyrinomonadaceae bacterium]